MAFVNCFNKESSVQTAMKTLIKAMPPLGSVQVPNRNKENNLIYNSIKRIKIKNKFNQGDERYAHLKL